MRHFVIGDIHGGYLALKQVLEAANFDYEKDTLISLGDLCDGWSETHLVIEELQKMKNLVLLRGNHDVWTLQALATRYGNQLKYDGYEEAAKIADKWYTSSFFKLSGVGGAWYAHGGRATEKSFENEIEKVVNALEFLDSALDYYIDDENRFFSHAGPHPSYDLESTPVEEFYWNREFWYRAWTGKHPGKPWKEVYIGHTPTIGTRTDKDDKTKPLNRYNVWNMDTGACFHGKLSMMNIDTKELFQSEVVRKLYPDETGRMGVTYNQQSSF